MVDQVVRTSKFLSYILRHNPGAIGLALDEAGWAEVDELLRCAAASGRPLSREMIVDAVAHNDKQRFNLSQDGRCIRANQGHSIPVDLGLQPLEPPEILFHGTALRYWGGIERDGLRPGRRQHVHLSLDLETARQVGQRHGKVLILEVAAGRMGADGFLFYRSANGVWLTERVPPQYVTRLSR